MTDLEAKKARLRAAREEREAAEAARRAAWAALTPEERRARNRAFMSEFNRAAADRIGADFVRDIRNLRD